MEVEITFPIVELDLDQYLLLLQGGPRCHSLDVAGRPLCGATLTGERPAHPMGDCAYENHPHCLTCRSLWDVEDATGSDYESCQEAA